MKIHLLVIVVATCLCFPAAAYTDQLFKANKLFLEKQIKLHGLFWHFNEESDYYHQFYENATSWNIEDHINDYTNKEAVHKFLKFWKEGMLPRGEIMSIFYGDIKAEMIFLFNLFYYAKDFDTFYNTAAWAKINMNEHMYIYTLTMAILHRPDTKNIRIPNFGEIMPHFFFNEDIIFKVQRIFMGETNLDEKSFNGVSHYILSANHTGWYLTHDHDMEWKLNYFTEDVGLNSGYIYLNAIFPAWLSSEKYNFYKKLRGSLYYYFYQRIAARYYMERLSNDLGEVEDIDWNKPIVTGYYPSMIYSNGLRVPTRPAWSEVPVQKNRLIQKIQNIESRVSMAVDSGLVLLKDGNFLNIYSNETEGLNILGNIIQGNMDSPFLKYYDSFDKISKTILGFGPTRSTKYQTYPGSLELSPTSMRDPAFYRLYKKILNYFLKYKSNLPTYTEEQLAFPGVKIDSLAVNKLVTFFDYSEYIISDSIHLHGFNNTPIVHVRKNRLNHLPFIYHIAVNSEKTTNAWISVFLGPKYNAQGHEIDIMENWMNFLEMDKWVVDLKSGNNKIERRSHESVYAQLDDIPSSDFYNMLVKAMSGRESYKYTARKAGFPNHIMLPKGKPEGMTFKLFAHITPYVESETLNVELPVLGLRHIPAKPYGYPLDRPIHSYISLPNMFWKDVVIYHKKLEDLIVTD